MVGIKIVSKFSLIKIRLTVNKSHINNNINTLKKILHFYVLLISSDFFDHRLFA